MNNDSVEQPADDRETQQASNEATERMTRLQLWLNGLLAGGPPFAEAARPWREGLPIYHGAAEGFAEDRDEAPAEDDTNLIEEPLMAAISRLRQRRDQTGDALLEIHEDEQRRRLTEVVERVKAEHRAGAEFTPMDIVLAARYIEGVTTPEEYRSRR